MIIQPKPYINRHSQIRHKAIGPERRLNAVREVMDKSTILPKSVTYEDIDRTVFEWVEKTLEITHNGKRIPTYKLFSNQRISEYGQTWQYTDSEGNVEINFKTITRDNNPQKGENQGMMGNVPGNHSYSLFKVPVLQENGDEIYELYSVKQPVAVNFNYIVVMVCDKYRMLNELNMKIHDEFKSLECYVFPNGHAMPMLLDSVDDESEYDIQGRKYYSQAYHIKLMGYIIKPDDYSVVRIPSRFKVGVMGAQSRKKSKQKTIEDVSNDIQTVSGTTPNNVEENVSEALKMACETSIPIDMGITKKPVVLIEEEDNPCYPDEESPYYYQSVKLTVDFPVCEERKTEFNMDINMGILDLILTNILDFKVFLNSEEVDFETEDLMFSSGSTIRIIISKEDEYKDSSIVFMGFNPDIVFDKRYNPESPLDDPKDPKVLDINPTIEKENENLIVSEDGSDRGEIQEG